MKEKSKAPKELTRKERGEQLRDDVIAQLENIVGDCKQELSDGGRLEGAHAELSEVKSLVGGWLQARAARLNIAAEGKRR